MDAKEKIEIIRDLKRDSFSELNTVNSDLIKYLAFASFFVAILSVLLNMFRDDKFLEKLSLLILFVLLIILSILFISNYKQINRIRKDIASHYENLQKMLFSK